MIKDDLPRDDYREKKLQRLEEIKNERKEAGVGQLIFEKEMFNQFQAMTIADVWTFDTLDMTSMSLSASMSCTVFTKIKLSTLRPTILCFRVN